ncbi:MAG: hypothetical protein V4858_07260 [Pseudomonadota bacterium]
MPRHILKYTWWFLLAFTLMVGAVIAIIDEGIRTSAAALGIVSFELCAYTHTCADILRSWDTQATKLATLSLGVDYLFMLLYPAAIFVSLWVMLPLLGPKMQTVTRWVAWSSWGMAITDALENYFLTQMVLTESVYGLAWPAAIFASIKFFILAITLGWLLVTWLVYAFLRPSRA